MLTRLERSTAGVATTRIKRVIVTPAKTPARCNASRSVKPSSRPARRSPITHCLASRPQPPSGLNWLGWGDGNRYTVYCDNDVAHDGGGWALAMELNTSSWDDEAPPLRYDDLFWEDQPVRKRSGAARSHPSARKYVARSSLQGSSRHAGAWRGGRVLAMRRT